MKLDGTHIDDNKILTFIRILTESKIGRLAIKIALKKFGYSVKYEIKEFIFLIKHRLK